MVDETMYESRESMPCYQEETEPWTPYGRPDDPPGDPDELEGDREGPLSEQGAMEGTQPNQKVYDGSRTHRRSVTEVRKTLTGYAGKVRIKGRDLVARHWFANLWGASVGQPWATWSGR